MNDISGCLQFSQKWWQIHDKYTECMIRIACLMDIKKKLNGEQYEEYIT